MVVVISCWEFVVAMAIVMVMEYRKGSFGYAAKDDDECVVMV